MVFMLESRIREEDNKPQEFANAKPVAAADWNLCEEHNLEMPNDEWTFELPWFGVHLKLSRSILFA